MKIYRISGLVLAALCCMSLVLGTVGARMDPGQGPDLDPSGDTFSRPGPGNGNYAVNATEQGNLTAPPGGFRGPPPGNLTEINGTMMRPSHGKREAGNTTVLFGNFTSPPPIPGNRTWSGNATDGNLTPPPPRHGNQIWSGNETQGNLTAPPPMPDHKGIPGNETVRKLLDQAVNDEDFVEALLAWLQSYFSSRK